MGTIAVLSSPLSTHSLSKLLDISQEQIDQTLNELHAILDIPKDSTQPLRLHHPSFRDFLLNGKRCANLKFGILEKQMHQNLAIKCIDLLYHCLRQDVLGMVRPGALVTDVEISRVKQCLLPEVQYACLYWTQHLQNHEARLQDNGQEHRFLQSISFTGSRLLDGWGRCQKEFMPSQLCSYLFLSGYL